MLFKEKNRQILDAKKRGYFFLFALVACTICLSLNCCSAATVNDVTDGTTGSTITVEHSEYWSEKTHGDDAEPDYSVVFPDNEVSQITIVISPEDWQTMLSDMTSQFGDFGTSSHSHDRNMDENPDENSPGNPPGGSFGKMDYDMVYVPATIIANGLEWDDVGIRFKGQSTLSRTWESGSYKISFKLDFDRFEDTNPEIKNQRFYGFDELNLKSGCGDSSLIKDKIVPEILNDAGVTAPDTAYYKVYVDYGEGPVYFGLYTMIESVEDTLIETQFADGTGNVYKPEGTGATFAEGTFDTDSFEKKTNKDEENYDDVEALYNIINDDTRISDPVMWRENLEEIFNVDDFICWLAVNTVIQNWDSYGGNCKNFYLYSDPSTGMITWIPWDNNEALSGGHGGGDFDHMDNETMGFFGDQHPPFGDGNENQMNFPQMPEDQYMPPFPFADEFNHGGFNGGKGMENTLSLSLDEVDDSWPLIRYLMDDPVYYSKYCDYLYQCVTTVFNPEVMETKYQAEHDLIEPYVTGADGEIEGYTNLKNPEEFDESVNQLIEHTNSRYDAVMEFLAGQTDYAGVV